MKTLYVICDNHMDPIWKRCWKEHSHHPGTVIRPYADIEEAQVAEWLDMAEEVGARYGIEQSLTVKMYLERRPDEFERLKRLAHEGMVEFQGGGETVIDYNMVCGESIVRCHLYSIDYYRRTFGIRPTAAVTPDTFGVSGQLPQVFRKLGYRSVTGISRVFPQRGTFWKGIDGHIVLIAPQNVAKYARFWVGTTMPNIPPQCCDGAGCLICGYTGLDNTVRIGGEPDVVAAALAGAAASEAKVVMLHFLSEEGRMETDVLRTLKAKAAELGMDVQFRTNAQFLNEVAGDLLQAVTSDTVPADQIDPRREGNCTGTGCYVSRSALKKCNRRLEDMLLTAETFSAFAADKGEGYPRKRIESLWNTMALIQFHDSITGSHSDAAYHDLIKMCRDVERGAADMFYRAAAALTGSPAVAMASAATTVAVFNRLSWNVERCLVDVVVPVVDSEVCRSARVADSKGRELTVVGVETYRYLSEGRMKVTFVARDLPAVGYAHFTVTPVKGEFPVPRDEDVLEERVVENDRYRLTVFRRGIKGIFDKKIGRAVSGSGTGDLILQEDQGSPWETLAHPYCPALLTSQESTRCTVKVHAWGTVVRFHGVLDSDRPKKDQGMRKADWCQEVFLVNGVDEVRFRTSIDWDTSNARLVVQFPLGFRTPEDEAWYRIPFGVIKRESYEPKYGIHMCADGNWPALDFVACRDEAADTTVAVMNRGLPANRVKDGTLFLSLIRSPQIPVFAIDFAEAAEPGKHVFEYALISGSGSLKDCRVVERGMEYNSSFMAAPVKAHNETPASRSFLSVESNGAVAAAVKLAESNSDLVVRVFDAYGAGTPLNIGGVDMRKGATVDLLEDPTEGPAAVADLAPFEIRTVRILR